MANEESHKEFLFLIRDFSTHRSHGDRRLSHLNNRILHLTSHLDSASSLLHLAKQSREHAEQHLKATHLRLAITSASLQPLHSRACNLHQEVSRIASQLDVLKNKEDADREEFKTKMLEMNAKIREFQERAARNTSGQQLSELPLNKGEFTKSETSMLDSASHLKGLEENLKCINDKRQMHEAEYEKQLKTHTEVCKELESLRRKINLVESITAESKILQELAGQTAELERENASLGEELEKKYVCPSCGSNNMASVQASQH